MPTFPNGYHHSEDLPHKQFAGLAFPEQLRGACGAVRIEIIVTQNNQGVGLIERIFDDPGFRYETKHRVTNQIEKKEKSHDAQGDNQLHYDAATLLPEMFHELGSRARKLEAACSGNSGLK